MTKIKYKIGQRTEVTMSGHALAEREGGHDLCCAAASMLAYTLMKAIDDLPLKDKVICFGDGFAHVSFCSKGKKSAQAQSALKAVLGGFRLLKREYPNNICIISDEEEKQ